MTPDSLNPADTLDFLPEDETRSSATTNPPWKILIVDDEEGVHAATRLALRDIRFRDRGLEFVSAFTGAEALAQLRDHPDIAMMFLDVVMETDDAGLTVAKQIRNEGFNLVRIVLRTGHPGYAPEREVIVNYDIHDYKEKSALDFSKLFSCLISALRAHDDLVAIERHRRGLVAVLEAVSWFDFRSLQRYLSRMLSELSSLANIEVEDLLLATLPAEDRRHNKAFTHLIDGLADAPLTQAESAFIQQSLSDRQSMSHAAGATVHIHGFGMDLVLFTRDTSALATADLVLLELFLNKVAQALDNHHTFAEILRERDSLVRNCTDTGDLAGGHNDQELKSMQCLAREISARLLQRMEFPGEIDDWFVFSIGTACAFHDLGVQALPHQMFEKAGPLSAEERAEMQGHTRNGVAMLRTKIGNMQNSRLFLMSENVILQHHERYDGSGYPSGLAGKAITLPARIIGLVDTFIAMTSPRPYRPARAMEDTLRHIRNGRGTLFDPHVTDAFFDVIETRGCSENG